MKNKSIKNKPQKCGRWLFLHSRFSKIFREGTEPSLIKGVHQLNSQNLSSKSTAATGKKKKKKEKEPESPHPLKQSIRNLSLSLGYTEIEKRKRALGQDLFCAIFNWAA